MPELPEVETVVRGLRKIFCGDSITRVRVTAPESSIMVGSSFKSKSFSSLLRGRKVTAVDRRGKNILIRLSGGLTLWVHLKMTGKFLHRPITDARHKHDLVTFDLASTEKTGFHLRFNDYRRFGRLRLYADDELIEQPGIKSLGAEPLELQVDDFISLCLRRPRMLKPALLDQTFIAGIGNIYADESLHRARLHPRRLTNRISRRKLGELHSHIQTILSHAIENMGSSVDTYSGVNGQSGTFQNYLKVYGREGEGCNSCGSLILREIVGSRSSHFCPRCQRLR